MIKPAYEYPGSILELAAMLIWRVVCLMRKNMF